MGLIHTFLADKCVINSRKLFLSSCFSFLCHCFYSDCQCCFLPLFRFSLVSHIKSDTWLGVERRKCMSAQNTWTRNKTCTHCACAFKKCNIPRHETSILHKLLASRYRKLQLKLLETGLAMNTQKLLLSM